MKHEKADGNLQILFQNLILNKTFLKAKDIILSHSSKSIVASSALHTAIDMLEDHDALKNKDPIKLKFINCI